MIEKIVQLCETELMVYRKVQGDQEGSGTKKAVVQGDGEVYTILLHHLVLLPSSSHCVFLYLKVNIIK